MRRITQLLACIVFASVTTNVMAYATCGPHTCHCSVSINGDCGSSDDSSSYCSTIKGVTQSCQAFCLKLGANCTATIKTLQTDGNLE